MTQTPMPGNQRQPSPSNTSFPQPPVSRPSSSIPQSSRPSSSIPQSSRSTLSQSPPSEPMPIEPPSSSHTLFLATVGLFLTLFMFYPFVSPIALVAAIRTRYQISQGKYLRSVKVDTAWVLGMIGVVIGFFQVLIILMFLRAKAR